jgi:hypothetical protein
MIDRFYDALSQATMDQQTENAKAAADEGEGEDEDARDARLNLESAGLALKELRDQYREATSVAEKRSIQADMSDVAERALAGEEVYKPKPARAGSKAKAARSKQKAEEKAIRRWLE